MNPEVSGIFARSRRRWLAIAAGAWLATVIVRGTAAAQAADAPAEFPRPPATWAEVQVELSRRGFSGGAIDGVRGPQSAAALKAFQKRAGVPETGELDAATRAVLLLEEPPFAEVALDEEDFDSLQPVGATWLEKSQQTALAHATALELAAERFRTSQPFLRRLNPEVDWDEVTPETSFLAPRLPAQMRLGRAARLAIALEARTLEAFDRDGALIAHFPVSIAKKAEKRPVGELRVIVVVADPDYTFDPALFSESEEARTLGRKLILPPGPNNPVGVAWIGLDRPGYGIHGTPEPEKVGRTESHGCFRLANWDARTLLELVAVGTPVVVEP